ncbi:MAG: N-acetyl-gamma-glutamyl-phosphate reductase [Planctomycetota bacterium]|jgi:N-acetyl-gamma-glutamyl-phosphate reductase
MSRIDVAIFGSAGYGGQELLHLLTAHPHFRVSTVTSRRMEGRNVEDALPQLEGFYPGLRFASPEDDLPDGCAGAFLATPHGVSQPLFARLHARHPDLRVVDLSGDFRLKDRDRFYAVYGAEHRFPAEAAEFAYGLTETNRAGIMARRFVANPGCFATGAILALAPLAERGLLRGDIGLAQTTGSSGSGVAVKETTHHPERAQDMRAYKVLTHQHEPEIDQELLRLGAQGFDLGMVPQSGPFTRGIFTVAHASLEKDCDVTDLYAERYKDEFFVRLRQGTPTLRHVARTNFCDLSVHVRGRRVVVLTAIDNLGKGMAGQAIQNMNLLFGLDETAGLRRPGVNP